MDDGIKGEFEDLLDEEMEKPFEDDHLFVLVVIPERLPVVVD